MAECELPGLVCSAPASPALARYLRCPALDAVTVLAAQPALDGGSFSEENGCGSSRANRRLRRGEIRVIDGDPAGLARGELADLIPSVGIGGGEDGSNLIGESERRIARAQSGSGHARGVRTAEDQPGRA